MTEFENTERNRVRRVPDRALYDKETIYRILDAGFLCHVGFVADGRPLVIPTLYGRDGDHIFLHGSAASRMLRHLSDGAPACLTVAHVDGLVLARSAFHHSVNYRSVVVFGTATKVEGEEKDRGLAVISESVLRGRWDEVRAPNRRELRATSVLRLAIESASAKVRTGPPLDEPEDLELDVWAGVLPIEHRFGQPEAAPDLAGGGDLPVSVRRALFPGGDREARRPLR